MGLAWQQGPLVPGAIGRFLVPDPLPDRLLFAEPLVLLEPGRYPVTFGTLPAINPGLTGQGRRPPYEPDGPAGTGPLVTFARSGITAPFAADGRSVLDLADACDVPTRWSCRTGVCHTCITPLLSGRNTYSPAPLEFPADGQVLICCARPSTDLVLDM
jgi:ferredoxin